VRHVPTVGAAPTKRRRWCDVKAGYLTPTGLKNKIGSHARTSFKVLTYGDCAANRQPEVCSCAHTHARLGATARAHSHAHSDQVDGLNALWLERQFAEAAIADDTRVEVAFPVGAVVGAPMPPTMARAVRLAVGDRVEAPWGDNGDWYEATVERINTSDVVHVRYKDDGVVAELSCAALRRFFRAPTRWLSLDTTGWRIASYSTEGDLVFLRPAPPVPHRGSAATTRTVAYIWKDHPEIMQWLVFTWVARSFVRLTPTPSPSHAHRFDNKNARVPQKPCPVKEFRVEAKFGHNAPETFQMKKTGDRG
jgi:hypothetical protein